MKIKNTLMLSMGILLSQSIYAATTLDGIVKVFPGKPPLLFTAGVLSGLDEIQLEFPGKGGRAQCCTKAVIEKEIQLESDEVVADELSNLKMHAYRLKFNNSVSYPDPFIGLAVIGGNVNVRAKGMQYQITDKKVVSTVSTCYSSEGMHLIRREGKRKLSHLYISLGYDVEPNCPKKM